MVVFIQMILTGNGLDIDHDARNTVVHRNSQQVINMLQGMVNSCHRPIIFHSDGNHAAVSIGHCDDWHGQCLLIYAHTFTVERLIFNRVLNGINIELHGRFHDIL